MKKNKTVDTQSQKKLKSLLKIEISSPAIFGKNTSLERTIWQLPNGEIHRDYGPAIEFLTGEKIWIKNGFIHREDGPALENGVSGLTAYWILTYYRREDEDEQSKPWAGNEHLKYWINGVALTDEEFNNWKNKTDIKKASKKFG